MPHTVRPFVIALGVVASHAALYCNSYAAAPNVKTVSTPANGNPTAAKIDSNGTIHLVFESSDGPQYVRSTDQGETFSSPLPLVDRASRKPGLEFITWDLAISRDGSVHVALGNNAWKLKLPRDEWGFFYTRLLPKAKGFEPLKNINHKPSEGFSLAVGESGKVSVVWMADKMFVNVSTDGGKTFSSASEIDPILNPCNCCTTSSVFGKDGRLAILYREETNNERDMYLALWDQKRNQVKKTRVSTNPWKIDTCPMTYYSISADDSGYLAAWPTKGEIYFTRLDLNGVPLTPVETKTSGQNGMRSGIIALKTNDGDAVVVWKKDNRLSWQAYDSKSNPLGLPGSARSEGNGAAGVVTSDGLVVLFQ